MSDISTLQTSVSELRSRISNEATTLSTLESRIETTTVLDLRLIRSSVQEVIGEVHNRLLAITDAPQTPGNTVATEERENSLARMEYEGSWLQEGTENITDRLDAAVKLTTTILDRVGHLSEEAVEYRGLNLVPLRRDVEAAHTNVEELQVVMERRLRTIQEEKDDIEANLKQKQEELTRLRSKVRDSERTYDSKQSEAMAKWTEAIHLLQAAPGSIAAYNKARTLQEEGDDLREHTERLREQSLYMEKGVDSLYSECNRHWTEISITYSELSSVQTSLVTHSGFQQTTGIFLQRINELDHRISALQGLLGQLKSEMTAASLRMRENQNQAWMAEFANEPGELMSGLLDIARTLESCYESVDETLRYR
ncbi:hypothetical protein BDD12DRAFT_808792 [Trichophaea hybrida]|nr:hypothetical protein BDD12DRAFT_808792 [Trichophaea hybrida]